MAMLPVDPKSRVDSYALIVHPMVAQQALCEELVQKSFELQKAEVHLFPLVGRVTALIGTSSVGKSSIIAAMRAKDSDLQETGMDLVGCDTAYRHFRINCPDELAFLQSVLKPKPNQNHIHEAVRDGMLNFKDSVLESDRVRAKESASILMASLKTLPQLSVEEFEFSILDRAMQLSLGGRPCVFDLINVDTVAKHALGRMPKKVALVYCPLDVYVSRIQNRNRKAIAEQESTELRLGVFHLNQMAEVFRPIQNKGETVLFTITRRQLIENFNKLFEDWNSLGNVDVRDKYDEELAKALKAFGFIDPSIQSIDFTPRFKGYDAIIDTSVTNPVTSARILTGLTHEDFT